MYMYIQGRIAGMEPGFETGAWNWNADWNEDSSLEASPVLLSSWGIPGPSKYWLSVVGAGGLEERGAAAWPHFRARNSITRTIISTHLLMKENYMHVSIIRGQYAVVWFTDCVKGIVISSNRYLLSGSVWSVERRSKVLKISSKCVSPSFWMTSSRGPVS